MKLTFDNWSKGVTLMLALLFTTAFAFAQRTISGTVIDTDGEPLIGANLLVVGTSSGTVTDINGAFSMLIPADATALKVSYTGYADQEVDVTSGDAFDIILSEGSVLDEVVVVGYGTQTREEVTSAVASLDSKDFNVGNITDASQLLQGKVAGVSIARPGGNPNAGFNIRLRGLSSVGANAQPLIIVNGVPGADLNSIDPNDIETIDVLKDGSAAAIYGTRGASGVILITTKIGRAGESQISYNGYATSTSRANTVDMLNSSEHRQLMSQFGITGNDGDADTDWFDELTETSLSNVHNVSLSGGDGNTSYFASVGFRDIQGVAINTGFQQLNGRVNLIQKGLNDRLTVTLNMNGSNRESQFGFEDAFRYATIFNPTSPVRSDKEELAAFGGYFQALGAFDYYNPVAILEQNTWDGNEKVFGANGRAELEIVDGLKVAAFYAQERKNTVEGRYFSKEDLWMGAGRNGLAERDMEESKTQVFEATATYNQNFGNVGMKLLAGYSYQDFLNTGDFQSAGNFTTDAFGYDRIGAALDWAQGLGSSTNYRNDNKIIGFFGRANFNIDDTYFLMASVRREGSTKFGADRKWGVFPGISAGVNLAKLTDIGGVDNLKLRVGYGVTGNTPDRSYLSIAKIAPLDAKFFFGGTFVPSYGPVSNENPLLQWETKSDFTVGLDFSLLDYKINGSLDYYNITTENMILDFPVPVPPNLFDRTFVNIGELNNSGLELALEVNAIKEENFSWTPQVTVNFYLNNDLISLSNEDFSFGTFRDISNLGSPGQNNTPTVRVEEGAPIGQLWGQQLLGIEEGKWVFADNDGDGATDNDVEDRAVIGNGVPDFEYGFTNNFSFGDVDLSFFLRGAVGHELVNTFRAFYETPAASNLASYNLHSNALNEEYVGFNDSPIFSDKWVENASFLRLENVTLGYSLPETGAFSRIRLYVNAQNLFTLTGYSGVDPEIRWTDTAADPNSIDSKLGIGLDRRNTYFTTRAFTFGVNLGF